MRLPSSVQGLIFAPVLVCLFFVLKAFCPESAGDSCFADQFAVPIFLPLVAIYKIFGDTSIIGEHDFILVVVYWAFVGFLIGLVIDLLWPRRRAIPISEPEPKPVAVPPQPKPKPAPVLETKPLVSPIAPSTPPAPAPARVIPLIKVQSPPPKPILPQITPPKAPPAPIAPTAQSQLKVIPITIKPPAGLFGR